MEIKEEIIKDLKKLGVYKETQFVILYGSVSKGKDNPLSDIDICISLSLSPKERMKVRMKLLGLISDKYDIQIFEDLPLYVQKSVLSGKLMYSKNKKNTIMRALQVIREYEDFEPVYNYYIAKDKSKVAIWKRSSSRN